MRYILLLFTILYSTYSHAGEYWRASYGGHFYGTSAAEACSGAVAAAGYQSCGAVSTGATSASCSYIIPANQQCSGTGFISASLLTGACPSQLPHEWPDGTCQATEPPTCEAGSDVFNAFVTLEQLDTNQYWVINVNGCAYDMTNINEGTCGVYTSGDKGCNVTYTQTDNPASEYPNNGTDLPDSSETQGQQSGGESDTRQNTSEQTIGENQVTDNGDGTSTEQQTTTETKTEAQGEVFWEQNGKFYHQDSSGNVTVTTEQTLIDRAADNSYTETVTSNSTVTSPTTTTTVIDYTNKTTQTSTKTGTTTSSGSTTTSTYNSSGVKTGSTTVSSGNGTGGQGEEGQAECDPEIMECSDGEDVAAGQPLFESPTESWWETSYPDGLSGIWADHSQSLDNGAVSTWLNSFGVPSSGSLPNWQFSCDLGIANFGTCDLSPPDYIWAAIRIFILLTAIFLCRKLIFGG